MIHSAPHIPSFGEVQSVSKSRGQNSQAPHLWYGLTGLWLPYAGVQGERLLDWSRYGRHGTLTNMAPATDWVVGSTGWALEFAGGSSQYVSFAAQSFGANVPWTTCTWVKPTSFGSNPFWLGHGPPNLYTRQGTTADTKLYVTNSGNGTKTSAAGAITTDVWQFVCVCRIGDALYYSIDGENWVVLGAGIASTTYIWATLGVGYFYYYGQTGATSIYDRPLSSAEVQELYERPYAMTSLRTTVNFKSGAAPASDVLWYYRAQQEAVA